MPQVAASPNRPSAAPVHARSSRRSRAPLAVRAQAAPGASSAEYDAVIVGGGISGLVAAQALAAKHGVSNFLVTEARERVGGNITSLEANGYIWEEGPNSFQPNDSMLQIAVDSGCDSELVFGDPTAPRFVWWENKLRPVPSGLDAVTFDLMSLLGKIRAGLGAVGLFKAPMPDKEESVKEFITRNLGEEVFARLIEPFCSGVYAGDPSKLSMKAAFYKIWILEKDGGSLVGGALKLFSNKSKNPAPPRDPRLPPKPKGQTVGSFRKGLRTVTDAIARNIKDTIRTNWKLTEVSKDAASGNFVLRYDTPQGPVEVRARQVVSTVPAWVAADLFRKQSAKAADALASFDYPPVGAVTVAYPISAVKDERKAADGSVPGFGQLHPRSQKITTLGTIYSSSLFPGRCPPGQMLLLNYIGGATNRGIVNQTPEELVAQVDKDLRQMLIKADAPKPTTVGVRVWNRAIPQFNLGHGEKLEAAKNGLTEAGLGDVILGGNYVCGVALGKVVEHGYELADTLASRVRSSGGVEARAPAASSA